VPSRVLDLPGDGDDVGRRLGIVAGEVLGGVLSSQLQRDERRRQEAHLRAPLTRLGVSGIVSVRERSALDEVIADLADAADPEWSWAREVSLLPMSPDRAEAVVAAGQEVVVVEFAHGDDQPEAVAHADLLVDAVAEMVSEETTVNAVVCVVDDSSEPRELPARSGLLVTVTGSAWLAGVVHQVLGSDGWCDEELGRRLAAAQERFEMRTEVVSRLLTQLNPASWWIVENLGLDDGGGESIGTVVAGPTGVFAVEYAVDAHDQADALTRAGHAAQRLSAYLPWQGAVPVVVISPGAQPLPAAPQVVPSTHLVDFVWHAGLRGIDARAVGWLNHPLPGWTRTPQFPPDGEPWTYVTWTD
jgi:hypothetical protein